MKIKSDTDLSKAVAAAGIRAVPRPAEPAAAEQAATSRDNAPPRERVASKDGAVARDSNVDREGAFERSLSTTKPPTTLQSIDLSLNVVSHGKLTWRTVLAWLRDDKIVSAEDVERTARRFAGGNSAQHPLVRVGSAGLTRVGDGKVLDTETLAEWLAQRSKLPYMRIDPLKVDVGRVADVMSIQYAERRHALPLSFGLTEVTIATCEPLDVAWVPGAWEIPLVAQRMALSEQYVAVLCLGAVIKGETTHDEHINRQVSMNLGEIALESDIPVLFGVLTCNTVEQAIHRAGGNAGNKGQECAEAALEMVRLLSKLP